MKIEISAEDLAFIMEEFAKLCSGTTLNDASDINDVEENEESDEE